MHFEFKYLVSIFILIFAGTTFIYSNELELNLKGLSKYRENIAFELILTNNSDADVRIPESYLNLFIHEKNCVVCDWFVLSNLFGKVLPHETIYIKVKTETLPDEEMVVIKAHSDYVVTFDNVQSYFNIPFWSKCVYAQYNGPLGISNKLKIKLF